MVLAEGTERMMGTGIPEAARGQRDADPEQKTRQVSGGPSADMKDAAGSLRGGGVIRLTVTVTDLKGPASARQINYIRAFMKTAAARGYRFRAAELSGITGRQASGLIGLLKEVRKLPERRMPGVRVDTAKVLEKMREPGDEKRFVIKLRAEEEGKKEEDA